jgi:hypothetical protein
LRITDEQLAALKVAHPRAKKFKFTVYDDVFDVVLRPATRAEYKAFRVLRKSGDETKSEAANEQLLVFTALFPDPKSVDLGQLLDKYPAVSDTLWAYAAEMVGMTAKVEVGD